jgi:ERF superfamily
VPVETLEKLFALREKVKAEQAREAFTQALADFQGDCPIIAKTKKVMNKDGRTVRYVYAPIDAIVDQIKKPLAKHGLSYTWNVEQNDKGITAVAKVTHKFGHSETSSFNVPIDPEGYMTAPQKVASALTFAKRYALCNALGISTGDEDTDATDVNKEPAAKSDKSKIVFLLRSLGKGTDTREMLETAVKDITHLTLEDGHYPAIIERLEATLEERNEAKAA